MIFFSGLGDNGSTRILGKGRLSKCDLIIEVIGTIDELCSFLGLARSSCESPETNNIIQHIQHDLQDLMAEIAASDSNQENNIIITSTNVKWIESQIQILGENVKMPLGFIIPGDSYSSAIINVARTVARRAERRAVELFLQNRNNNQEILRYLNRLSSLCFVLELFEIKISDKSK